MTEHPSSGDVEASRDGLFVAFEGGDGAGKSTQVTLLAEAFEAAGRQVLRTRQPGGTPLGAALRDLVLHGEHVAPRAEALIFAADKAQHVEQVIEPALASGAVVITDRYTDSSVAYQGAGRELGAAEVHDLQMWAVGGLLPDVTIVIDVTPEVGRLRRGGHGEGEDRLEQEADDFHAAIRAHFLALAEGSAERYLVVDGAGDVETIHQAVIDGLRARGVSP